MNNKGTDQTEQKRRLVYSFAVRIQQSQIFSHRGAYNILVFKCSNFDIRTEGLSCNKKLTKPVLSVLIGLTLIKCLGCYNKILP